jgi:hypothetical protein
MKKQLPFLSERWNAERLSCAQDINDRKGQTTDISEKV